MHYAKRNCYMKFDSVIFDLDGTLLNTLDDLCDSVNFALSAYSFPERSLLEVRSFVGNGIANLIKRALPEGASGEDFDKVFSAFKEHYKDNSDNKTAPYPGVLELLSRLKREGVSIAVVSNKADFAVQTLVAKHFGSLIDFATGEVDGIARKPDPALALMAAERLSAKNPVYVGDSEVDVETCRNAHMSGVFVTWGFRCAEELSRAGAVVFADDTKELYERFI